MFCGVTDCYFILGQSRRILLYSSSLTAMISEWFPTFLSKVTRFARTSQKTQAGRNPENFGKLSLTNIYTSAMKILDW
jgi:hypothetical protein